MLEMLLIQFRDSNRITSHRRYIWDASAQCPNIIWLAFRGSSWLPLKEVHVCVRVHLQILDSTQTRLIFLARNTSKSRKEIFKIQAISWEDRDGVEQTGYDSSRQSKSIGWHSDWSRARSAHCHKASASRYYHFISQKRVLITVIRICSQQGGKVQKSGAAVQERW